MIEHVQGQTFHARRGALTNAFRYGVDYVLLDPDAAGAPWLLSLNRFNLWSVWDRNHGGPRDTGRGVVWFREVLAEHDFPLEGARLLLLTQPSFLGFTFNPVSFWLALRDDRLCAVVAEVNNTFGDRHCYFCAQDGFLPIKPFDTIIAEKLLYVSPFQQVAGQYRFNFAVSTKAINIRIAYENGENGVLATLTGTRNPATSRSLLWAAMRRPFGALRVLALIHWQAVVLFAKRAPFLRQPPAPETLVSDARPMAGGTE